MTKSEISVSDIIGSFPQRSAPSRTHIQKAVFLAQHLGLLSPTRNFVLHHYGPYSFGLDREIAEAVATSQLSAAVGRGGLGTKYVSESKGNPVLQGLASELSEKGVKELEAISTLAYFQVRNHTSDVNLLINQVRGVKPHLDEPFIRSQFEELSRIESEFKSARR